MNSGTMITAARQRHASISGGSAVVLAGLTLAMLLPHCALRGEWLASAGARRSAWRPDKALRWLAVSGDAVAAEAFR